MVKLTLNTSQAAQYAAAPGESTPTPSTAKIKLTQKPAQTPTASTPKTKAAGGAGSKKRPRESTDSGQGSASKKQATKNTIKLQTSNLNRVLKLKTGGSPATPVSATKLKIKSRGKPPPRPTGVGYDSEAEGAEDDPAIEENFVLRMEPGADCDYIRRAIEEKKIGIPASQGGADVHMRFFSRDGRRAAVTVQGRSYAAILVDLPCIIESMKSWDKRGWWKSSDICQMLLVLGKVSKEDDARDYPLPREVDHKTWQYPHGMTPPMHNVRRRRFRKRVSHRTIEAAEAEVNRLLDLDPKFDDVVLEELDLEQLHRQEQMEDDAEGEVDDDAYDDQDALFAQLEGQLMDGEDDAPPEAPVAESAPANVMVDVPTPIAAAMAAASPGVNQPTTESHGQAAEVEVFAESAAESAAEEEEEDEEEEDEDDEDDDDDQDEESREKAAELAEKRAAIKDLERQLHETRVQRQNMTNPIYQARFNAKIRALEQDLQVKKRDIGEFDEDDDF